MKDLQNFFRSSFVKGLLCGIITVILLIVSWRFVVLILGIAALYYLFCKKG